MASGQAKLLGVTTNYYLNNGNIAWQTDGTNTIHYTYDSNGNLEYMNLNGQLYYYERDGQGDIIGLVDSNMNEVVTYSYDTWGNLLSIGGSLASTVGKINPFRYRGYYYDTETKLYYLNSRYYDPNTGRFINADDQVSTGSDLTGMNLFAYCGNNPVMNVDPDRHAWWNNVWNFVKTAAANTVKNISNSGPAFAVCGGVVACGGEVDPVQDVGSIGTSLVLVLAAFVQAVVQTAQAGTKENATTANPPRNDPDTVIYRYGYGQEGIDKLVPTEEDIANPNFGLSFSTVPRPGVAMTTIGAVNATGILRAVQDGNKHVSVYPVGAQWQNGIMPDRVRYGHRL